MRRVSAKLIENHFHDQQSFDMDVFLPFGPYNSKRKFFCWLVNTSFFVRDGILLPCRQTAWQQAEIWIKTSGTRRSATCTCGYVYITSSFNASVIHNGEILSLV